MPPSHLDPPTQQDFLKRRTFAEGRALVDAAHVATQRLYCDTLALWRRCANGGCKRHRRCVGEATTCLLRAMPFVRPSRRLRAQQRVMAGGPRRLAPATHMEWFVRRLTFKEVVSWHRQ